MAKNPPPRSEAAPQRWYRGKDIPMRADCVCVHSDTPGAVRTTAPKRGEHTADLLRECGYSDANIEEMKAAGIAG